MSDDRTLIQAQDLSFEGAVLVRSKAQKFILPVPTFAEQGGGEALVYPPSAGQERAGQAILDWQGNPVSGTGVVFFNFTDQCFQAARDDGQSVVIFNQVGPRQADRLHTAIGQDPMKLELGQFYKVLDDAQRELDLGDRYNSSRQYIQDHMRPLEPVRWPEYGLHCRCSDDPCEAIRLVGRGAFQGPGASPQIFDQEAVILRQPNTGDGEHQYRLIQSSIFLETYVLLAGAPVKLEALTTKQV